jgi:hypothetical protein
MRFADVEGLRTYLESLHEGYGDYADALWSNGARTTDMLANNSERTLVEAGVKYLLHAGDIKVKAGEAAFNCLEPSLGAAVHLLLNGLVGVASMTARSSCPWRIHSFRPVSAASMPDVQATPDRYCWPPSTPLFPPLNVVA